METQLPFILNIRFMFSELILHMLQKGEMTKTPVHYISESDNLGSTDSEVKKILTLHLPISEYDTLGSDSEGDGRATSQELMSFSHRIRGKYLLTLTTYPNVPASIDLLGTFTTHQLLLANIWYSNIKSFVKVLDKSQNLRKMYVVARSNLLLAYTYTKHI